MSEENPSAPEMDPSPLNEVPEPPANPSEDDIRRAGEIEDALMDVIDPELGINVVDLGLVYDIWTEDKTVILNMTLTSPACPLQDMIEDQARTSVLTILPNYDELQINWVWTPAWGPQMINEEGREQLRYLGFTV